MPIEYPHFETYRETLLYLIKQLEIDNAPWVHDGAISTPEEMVQSIPDLPHFGVVVYDIESNSYMYRPFAECQAVEEEIAAHATSRSGYVVAALNLQSCRSMLISVRARVI